MKKTALIAGLAFLAGVYLADGIKDIRGMLNYEAKEGFAQHPYNLRIVHRETGEGIESYVLDTRTNEYWKIKDSEKEKDNALIKIVIDYLMD